VNTDRMWELVLDAAYKRRGEYDGLRFGQCLMIGLWDIFPEIYYKIAVDRADCFYDDRKVKSMKEAFFSVVEAGHDIY